ncbi:TcdC [Bifidobacterium anseris]|uniref:TcdC n=1 Tax=Bifidobacterium anseris TaxID=2020963 RepID=A0A2N5J2Y7_9BIFI|nr:hypothetical protein [Bifidobacterium anseris]PLS28549.1 TcdC [Bifidobacterium anseris]
MDDNTTTPGTNPINEPPRDSSFSESDAPATQTYNVEQPDPRPDSQQYTDTAPYQQAIPNTSTYPSNQFGSAPNGAAAIHKSRLTKWVHAAYISVILILAALLVYSLVAGGNLRTQLAETQAQAQTEQADWKKKNNELNKRYETLNSDYLALKDEMENGSSRMLIDVKNAYDAEDWNGTIEAADLLHEKHNGDAKDQEGQQLKKKAQQKIDEAKAAEERKKQEAEKKKQEEEQRKREEEAKGYDTGITYDQLARTPDDFLGKKVKFTGRVVQVLRGDETTDIRLAVDGNYDTILLGTFSNDLTKSRILEDDTITISGTSLGEYSYKAVLGQTISVPLVAVAKIDQ